MSKYSLFHAHSCYSILDGYSKPEANAKRAKECGITTLGISDHGNVFGHMDHIKACQEQGIKPALGVELYCPLRPLPEKKRQNCHLVIWCKNKAGYKDLVSLVSKSNDGDSGYFYYKPQMPLFTTSHGPGLEEFCKNGNLMGFSGHQGSHLSNNLFCTLFNEDEDLYKKEIRKAYGQYKGYKKDDYRQFLKKDWLESTCDLAVRMENIFGKGNFWIELADAYNPKDQIPLAINPLIVECLREVSKQTGIPAMASADPHYASPEDAQYQRILVMTNLKETEQTVEAKIQSEQDNDVMVFFGSNEFYIPTYDEMRVKFTDEELEETNRAAEQIEEFSLVRKAYMPNFSIPAYKIGDKDQSAYEICKTDYDKFLMYLCIKGAKEKKPWEKNPKNTKRDYWERLVKELKVIFGVGLSPYFLVVWDICMAADNRPKNHSFDWYNNLVAKGETDPIPRGQARGSGAGCCVSYMTGITGLLVDPLKYDLIFERFYDETRNAGDYIELPDIDLDFAVEDRDWIIEYIGNKYGKEKVGQIVTFGRIQGRAAIKDVFRTKGIAFEIGNEVCKHVPDEAAIADQIQAHKDGGEEDYGIIHWSIENNETFRDFYENVQFSEAINTAIKLEGVIRSSGKHPSGVVATPEPIGQIFPLVWDTKSKQRIIGADMEDVAKMGGVKLDILGTTVLDKLKFTEDLVNAG